MKYNANALILAWSLEEVEKVIRDYDTKVDEQEETIQRLEILLEASKEAQGPNCVAFGEWLSKNYHSIYNGKELYWGSYNGGYTTKELYKIFLNQQNEKNI